MKTTSIFTLKSNLRKTYLAKRRALSFDYRQQAEVNAAQVFMHLPAFKESEHIACYLPVKDEFDPRRMIEVISQVKKICYLPVLDCKNPMGKSLSFVRYQEGDPLQLNRYDIYEPINHEHLIDPLSLDLVLVPLIAFDLHGTRLGTGGGYYDRTFSQLKNREKPMLCGLAFDAQLADLLPRGPFDVPLNGVITESGFVKVG
jgi:5-formyltetrahydrofolate cyclo-ligase